ncbi:MAG: hypothetical protein IKH15_09065 [Bacteroidales bacterium]|nr:hypothetical protein [Bacteroidales bacterium]MBR6285150.1 hypothetical protein [Muribaculaceae bacterium]
MGDSNKDGRLSSELTTKIAALDAARPWVWQLRLNASEFDELETAVTAQSTDRLHGEQPWAAALLVYLAEWYKRRYQSGNSCPLLDARPDIKLETAWKTSSFAWKRLVYSDEGGNRRWLYSAYVLGGLAIRHELGRNDKLRFLKALCRIYHHDDYTLENIEDASRAISFRQSVKRHSLHDYMQEILNGKLPFNDEDLADGSEVNRFVTAMRTANDEVMRDKFRLEWVITNAPGYTTMSRTLRLWLRPEEVRGGLHQYLRYDRMSLWGIAHPEQLKSLKVGVRFLHGGNAVADVDWSHAPITFSNTGDEETGFVAVGVERFANCGDVPTAWFDSLAIVAMDNNGKEYELQREASPDLLQLWRIGGSVDQWTSLQNAQRETAVVFSGQWHLQIASTSEPVEFKPFRSKRHGKSEPWGWYLIYDKATLTSGDRELTLYNRQGYDRIATRLYHDTIHYKDGGYVKWIDEKYGDEELLPLIFGSDDVIARHFATKDDITRANPDEDTEIELLEYKQGAYFTEWTADSRPPYGKVTLRLTVKGRQLPNFEACYLPRLDGAQPIVRDFDNCAIRYATIGDNGSVTEAVKQDEIPLDFKPLHPTVSLHIGSAEVEVYRPTLIKEVYLGGKVINYLDDGEQLNLPVIYRRRTAIADFSRQGYRHYSCGNLAGLFAEPFINISGNPDKGMAALAAWEKGMRYPATALDALAPEFLYLVFGGTKNEKPADGEQFLFWNYAEGTEPIAVDYDDTAVRDRWGIIFQDLRNAKSLTCRFPLMNDTDTWAEEYDYISVPDCFRQAVKHNLYFFVFMPLRGLSKRDFEEQIRKPLLELRGGELTDEDLDGFERFAEEIIQ